MQNQCPKGQNDSQSWPWDAQTTQEGQLGGQNGPSRPIWLENGPILIDFASILVPKSVPKRLRRKAIPESFFEGVFEGFFDDLPRFPVELAFLQT